MILLSATARESASQTTDNPDRIHFRAGYFATPIKIDGYGFGDNITSIEIICDSIDETGGNGFVRVDQSILEFNDFGDATVRRKLPVREHPMTLVKHETAVPIKGRTVYHVVFNEGIWKKRFLLSLPDDRRKTSRLLELGEGKHPVSPSDFSAEEFGPVVKRTHLLTNLGARLKLSFDEPIGDKISFALRYFGSDDVATPHYLWVKGKLSGAGTFLYWPQVFDSHYGEYVTRLMQHPKFDGTNRLIEKELEDPLDLGRRIFEIRWNPDEACGDLSGPDAKAYSLVVCPRASGSHRMIIKHDGEIQQVVSAINSSWIAFTSNLHKLSAAAAQREALLKLRRRFAHEFDVRVDNGAVKEMTLNSGITDEVIETLRSFEDLKKLTLRKCLALSEDGLSAIGNLKSLEKLDFENTPISDRVLEALTEFKILRELKIHGSDSSQPNRESRPQITDNGLAKLSEFRELETLVVRSTKITDVGLEHLKKHNTLRNVHLQNCNVNPSALFELASGRKSPRVRFESGNLDKNGCEIICHRGVVALEGDATKDFYAAIADRTDIERLRLPETATDKNLEVIAGSRSLQGLRIHNNDNVTYEGLAYLSKLGTLRTLHLNQCSKLRDGDALESLREALPNCEITIRGDHPLER